MRRALDAVYAAALWAACLAMVATALLVLVQIAGRLLDRALILAGAVPLGLAVPSLAEIGGFLFVGSAMLALPATLRAGGHVRVTLLTGLLGEGVAGRGLRLVVLAAALALCSFAAWHSGVQAFDSWQFASVSFGMVRVPLWLPQGVMTAGLALFALALADELVVALSGRLPAHARAEGARSRGEG